MTKTYNSFEELHTDYANRYGEQWEREGRSCLSTEEEIAFVEACYELYPKLYKPLNAFKNTAYDAEDYDGRPFKIIEPIPCDNRLFDLESLPAYSICFTDSDETYDAYPEEIFDISEPITTPKPFVSRLTPVLNEAIDTVCGACPYIVNEDNYEAGEKYCDNCMVRLMVNLFSAEEKAQGPLPETAPEWQAIINY